MIFLDILGKLIKKTVILSDREERMKTSFEEVILQPFVKLILAAPQKKTAPIKKVIVRPVYIKNKEMFQIEKRSATQAFHSNLFKEDLAAALLTESALFKEIYILFQQTQWQGRIKEGEIIYREHKTPTRVLETAHNHEKVFLLPEHQPIPPLIELGIMDKNGTVFPNKRDKFIQINRFLDVLKQAWSSLKLSRPPVIWDLCCGKSYLSFILCYFFKEILKTNCTIFGADLKQDVIQKCQYLAQKLGYHEASFYCGDITHLPDTLPNPDFVISLHACDTATDAVLKQAVQRKASVILAVPCCHKELARQINHPATHFITKHGILKERLAALATDAFRAAWLENKGYKTDVFEFIDFENSPKNIMIRAQLTNHPAHHDLTLITNEWHISPDILKTDSKQQ